GTLANLSNPQIDERFYTVSCGTTAAVRTNIDTLRLCQNRKLFTYYQYQNNWVVGAPTNNAGDVWQWLKDKIFNLATFEELNDLAKKSPVGAKGLFFVPYIFGERAPIWNPDASGGFMGLTAIHTNKDLARAVLEGELYNINLIIKELNQFNGQKPDALVLVGGMAKNQFFDQLLADITGYKVYVPESVEASALGAAILAMISLKIIASPLMIQKELKIAKVFHVNSHNHGIYVALEKKWNKVRQLMTEEWLAVE
ncbi:MAG: FGGY-family carbohydrate kinase, partial [Bombilactobacillus sp.]|nr:FGGY-family carbohydrate kinase [Bombilactobacillus sp.]